MAAVALVLGTIATTSEAQNNSKARRLAMTVSGGVSLGSYQAGSTWALMFVLKNHSALSAARDKLQNPSIPKPPPAFPYQLDVLTGASAGNVNAILAAATYCSATLPRQPHNSLFWNAWTPIGFDDLIDQTISLDELGVFSRRAFNPIWTIVNEELLAETHVPDCNLLVGITTTKVTPNNVKVANGVDAPVQRFAGVFRIVSDGKKLAAVQPEAADVVRPEISDILILQPQLTADSQPVPLGKRWRVDNGSLRALVEASGAFPIAFSPRAIPHRRLDELSWAGAVSPPCLLRSRSPDICARPRDDRFVDGGIFDNRPLGLARQLAHALAEQRRPPVVNAAAFETAYDAFLLTCKGVVGVGNSFDVLSGLDQQLKVLKAGIANASDSAARDSLATIQRRLAQQIEAGLSNIDSLRLLTRSTNATAARCGDAVSRSLVVRDSIRQAFARDSAARSVDSLPTRLLYFIDDDARRGVPPEIETRETREARGGIASAVKVVLSAFETGSNYEMRLFAKGGYWGDLRLERETLGVNSRYPRLMAEHLNHFGAFLSKSFREHDFYAGVYDGVRSAFRELYCEGASPPGVSRVSCDAAWLRIALDQGILDLDPTGRAVISRLFAREDSLTVPALPSESHPRTLATLVEANIAGRGKNEQCSTSAFLIESPLCSFQLIPVLESWRNLLPESGKSLAAYICNKQDPLGCRFAKDPKAAYHGVLLRTLGKTWKIEDQLDQVRESGYPGSVQLPLFIERQYNEIYRSKWGVRNLWWADPNPTSSDALGGWWQAGAAHALPSSLTAKRDGSSRWMGWRPSAYLFRAAGSSFGVMAPLEWAQGNGRRTVNGGVGAFVLPPWPPLLSAVSVSWLQQSNGTAVKDITASFAAGVLRVGVRGEDTRPTRLFAGRNLTIGIGDANGMTARLTEWFGELALRNSKWLGASALVAGVGRVVLFN